MKTVKAIAVILGLSCIIGFSFLGVYLPGESQIRILEVIIIFASTIFAILGIWLAVVFPEVMSGIYKNCNAKDKRSLYQKGKRIIFPLVLASICAFSALLVRISAEVLANAGVAAAVGVCAARSVLLFTIILLVLGLGVSLIMAIAPGLQMLFEGYRAVKKAEREERYFSRVQDND